MEQRRFGDSDLVCSALGFGTWELSVTGYGLIDWGDVNRAVNLALDRGVTLFDTAEVYGPFHSELLLARALGARRKDVVLVTKVKAGVENAMLILACDGDGGGVWVGKAYVQVRRLPWPAARC